MFPFLGSPFLTSSLTSLFFISSRPIRDIPRGSISPVPLPDLSTPSFSLTSSLHQLIFGNGSTMDQLTSSDVSTALDLSTPSFSLTSSLHQLIFGNGSSMDQLTSSGVGAVLDPLTDVPPAPPRLRSYFSFIAFLGKLPDNLSLPGIAHEALFGAIHRRSVPGMGTYSSLNSIFVTNPQHIESFVV